MKSHVPWCLSHLPSSGCFISHYCEGAYSKLIMREKYSVNNHDLHKKYYNFTIIIIIIAIKYIHILLLFIIIIIIIRDNEEEINYNNIKIKINYLTFEKPFII